MRLTSFLISDSINVLKPAYLSGYARPSSAQTHGSTGVGVGGGGRDGVTYHRDGHGGGKGEPLLVTAS